MPPLKEHLAKPRPTSEESPMTCRRSGYVWISHFNFQWFPRVNLSFKLPEVLDEVSVESSAMFDSQLALLPSTAAQLESLRNGLTLCSSLTFLGKST